MKQSFMTGFVKMQSKANKERKMPDDTENAKNLDLLVKIANVAADNYIKDNEERAYAIIKKKEGHKELYPLRSQSFENWLGFIYY